MDEAFAKGVQFKKNFRLQHGVDNAPGVALWFLKQHDVDFDARTLTKATGYAMCEEHTPKGAKVIC